MIEMKVPDMTCGHCVSTITKAVKAFDSAPKSRLPLRSTSCGSRARPPGSDLVHCIAEAGYAAQPRPGIRLPKSRSTSRAQLWPGAPVTPPPGWAPEPQRYSPFTGVR